MLPTYDGAMARTLRRHHGQAVRITTAASSRADDIAARQRRYVVSMGIRTVCFVAAIVADGWLRWTLIVAALMLPYVAVVMANNTATKSDGFALQDGEYTRPELTDPQQSEGRPESDGI
jgi:Protein of unknown function (DUF3099)